MECGEDLKPAFKAFEEQLKTLCLNEFPCGKGSWREFNGKKRKQPAKKECETKFCVTMADYGAHHVKTERLTDLMNDKRSLWKLDYSWSDEAKQLREIAVSTPWLVDEEFVLSFFKTLRISDKGVTEIDEEFLKFKNLEELLLSANYLTTVSSRNLPRGLRVLEVCANRINDLTDLCVRPPPLIHLGLGYNKLYATNDYITGKYWPELLSLDLGRNNLTDLLNIIRKLQTLPKLRNLVLIGNPLALTPGYRGYTIDSLKKLEYLDDVIITADERHQFKGLAKRKECVLDEAKVTMSVEFIKNLPMPEELKHPDDQPEFPIVNRKYFIQFMFLESRSQNVEILEVLHDGLTSTVLASPTGTPQPTEVMNETPMVLQTPDDAKKSVDFSKLPPSVDETTPEEGERIVCKTPHFGVAEIRSTLMPWAEMIDVNWVTMVTRDDLLSLRNFFISGMEAAIVEEKILSNPAPEVEGLAPAQPEKGKKPDKKGSAKEDKKAKGKKKTEPEVNLVHSPPEYTVLAQFHVPLITIAEGEFGYSETVTCTEAPPTDKRAGSPDSDTESLTKKDKKDAKDGRRSKVNSALKKNKDVKGKDGKKSPVAKRRPSLAESVKGKHDGKGNKGKQQPVEPEPVDLAPPPPMEVKLSLRLQHWECTADCLRGDDMDKDGDSIEAAP
ncbi:hypothetical protein NP493_1901g00010 [Ridgeia piscesae]|uniref:Leucine-rich repeat-containing protein 43 n=1 Tax=Ridgeia piscesae TaxID=27915 RepID=A0AAD9JR94_RIDPI|nr:hypothetical protein NP493_1901g00010 [Ridgeia piscesae]